jgi:hypothetical protein
MSKENRLDPVEQAMRIDFMNSRTPFADALQVQLPEALERLDVPGEYYPEVYDEILGSEPEDLNLTGLDGDADRRPSSAPQRQFR